ncbi:MAG: oligopeptide transporter, OPT family [bacterium]|jgi:putative OPT family oligopeptide transporter|nr:oligopeptide transporter, OPT family [candidate division KSB1 bacterium]MDH7561022.1 oligopeptide transporter, OPT family [bacterium]
MAEPKQVQSGKREYKPFVPPTVDMKEFTLRALIPGLVMAVVLGAANAYLGLKAGMTIAATYPAAVLSMAILRFFKDSNILEENLARTVGSIGESVAAGAIFTLPAFLIAGVWTPEFFGSLSGYLRSSIVMLVGGAAGILFVTLLRRMMVDDPELPFPESVAAAEIHKAGRGGASGAQYLFYAMGIGGLVEALKTVNIFASKWQHFVQVAPKIIPGTAGKGFAGVETGGGFLLKTPALSPAFLGVGYIIGPRLAALNFAGGALSWGLFVPLLMLLLAPQYAPLVEQRAMDWVGVAENLFANAVRPIAIGGMLVSAAFTLFRMRKSLAGGIKRSVEDVRKAASAQQATLRTDRDINIKVVFAGLAAVGVLTFFVYWWFMGLAPEALAPALVAALVMMLAGFFFAAVSGYLVGLIGSSNNPISGLTLSTLVIAAVLMVILGATGTPGVIAVLAVAGVICVSAAVAGEMLQDLKVGHILGGTPWRMQVGDFIGVLLSAAVMWIPLFILNAGDLKMAEIKGYDGGFGGKVLAAPQATLMAKLAQGIVGGEMAWPLIIVGMLLAIGFILVQVRSPMLVCVGMYLSFETVAAIFVGGIIRWVIDVVVARRKYNENQKTRIENRGILLASGLIAGEALVGLLVAALVFFGVTIPNLWENSSFLVSVLVIVALGYLLVKVPLGNAGSPDEPAAPAVM